MSEPIISTRKALSPVFASTPSRFGQRVGARTDISGTVTPRGTVSVMGSALPAGHTAKLDATSPTWLEQQAPDSTASRGSVFQKVFNSDNISGLKQFVPYVSNALNAFRKPPMPTAPEMVEHLIPQRINLDASRVDIQRALRGQNLSARRNLDANTAAAVEMGGMAQGLTALNGVNTQEANANAELAARTAQANVGIDVNNTQMRKVFNDSLVERNIADQQFKAANLANASDKFMAQEDVKSRNALEAYKANVMATAYANSGVWDRIAEAAGKNGWNNIDPITGMPIKKRMGGQLKKVY